MAATLKITQFQEYQRSNNLITIRSISGRFGPWRICGKR